MATFTEITTIIDNLVIDLEAALGHGVAMNQSSAAVAATTPGDADAVWGSGNANLAPIAQRFLKRALIAQRQMKNIGTAGETT